jgi:phage repressor protein C with HTH and peptisase S24 domain
MVKCARELEEVPFPDYLPEMAIQLSTKIRLLRKKLGLKQPEFADRVGVSQGTVSRWESGAAPTHDHLLALAKLDGISLDEFLLGAVGRPAGEQGPPIPVVGYVGAGASVYPIDDEDQASGFGTIERPPFITGEAIAVEVRGDSLVPVAEDGWKLIYTGEQEVFEDEVLNKLCVVALADGRVLVKRLVRGSKPQRYHLLSTNAPMIEDAEVLWAAKVRAIIPA